MKYSEAFLDTLLVGYKRALRMDDRQMIRQVLAVCEEIGVIRADSKNVIAKVNKTVDNFNNCGIIKMDGEDDPDGGHWKTTEEHHKIHINEEGVPDKGNPYVLAIMSGDDPNGSGVAYEKTHNTSKGSSFPKIKVGAAWDADTLKEVDRLAKEGNKEDAYDDVVSKLTESDVVYQTDPEGQVVAAVPGLSQMYDSKVTGKTDEVQAAYEERIKCGEQIAKDMVDISNSLGSRMMGLENCFKGGASTSRKIDKVKEKEKQRFGNEISDSDALAKMDDVVRFTYKCDHDHMVQQIKQLEGSLEGKGYKILERDNKFLPKSDGQERDYKAVHLQVLSPNGERFEVQIHSEETIKVKNKNHQYYEAQRELKKSDPDYETEYKRLNDIMVKNWAGMKVPDGITDLPSIE